MQHISVLLNEAISYLQPKQGGVYIDATFGGGGYTRCILQHTDCKVIAFDRDSTVLATTAKFKEQFGDRFEFINDTFSNIAKYTQHANGIVADFGISSMHVDNAERGFSFQKEARLDMRMGKCDISAFEVINEFSEEQIADIIFRYSNEHLSKKIASAIYHARKKGEIKTTIQLAELIYQTYGTPRHYKIHPATKTFQAIRIFVNKEFEEIEALLEASKTVLDSSGRLVCVSFHELEDRIVKNFLTENSAKREKYNKYGTEKSSQDDSPFTIITKKPIEPTPQEVQANPRSRSAKLRCGERTLASFNIHS